MDDIELDLRQLPAPQPLVRILDTLQTLAAGQRLRAYTPCRWPQPLLEVLDARAFDYELDAASDGGAMLLIRHRDDGAGD